MRHFLQGAPLPVPRLPSRMGTPASPGLLIHTARRPLPLPLGQRRTGRRTVSAPTVAGPTHKKLTPASGAATVDEIHAAASSPPGWTSSGPRAIQDLFGRSRFARGHLRGLGALTPGPWPIWGAVTSSPLRHHAWQHQPAPHDPPHSIRSPRRALQRSVPLKRENRANRDAKPIMKTAFLVDDDVVHGESPLSCVHSANSEPGHLPGIGVPPDRSGALEEDGR